MNIEEYIGLVTPEHQESPRYLDTVRISVSPMAHMQEIADNLMHDSLDLDKAVEGQLRILGEYIGIMPEIATDLSRGYFSWDTTAEQGWNVGKWRGVGDPTEGQGTLDDSLYAGLLKTKVLANIWDGSIEAMYAALKGFGNGNLSVRILDHSDFTFTIDITDLGLSGQEREILLQGLLPFKPAGITCTIKLSPAPIYVD